MERTEGVSLEKRFTTAFWGGLADGAHVVSAGVERHADSLENIKDILIGEPTRRMVERIVRRR